VDKVLITHPEKLLFPEDGCSACALTQTLAKWCAS